MTVEGDALDEIADATAGYSGAQVREIAYLAIQEAILVEDAAATERRQLDLDLVRDALNVVGRRKPNHRILASARPFRQW